MILSLPNFALEGGASEEINVSIDIPDADWSAARSPANLFALADVISESSKVRERAFSPLIFFHTEQGAMRAYGERVLRDTYHRGDLLGALPQYHDDESVISIIDATAGQAVEDLGVLEEL